jgi:hypothetical protein
MHANDRRVIQTNVGGVEAKLADISTTSQELIKILKTYGKGNPTIMAKVLHHKNGIDNQDVRAELRTMIRQLYANSEDKNTMVRINAKAVIRTILREHHSLLRVT